MTQLEIDQRITELGDDDFQVRQKAARRLAEIGVPALDALGEAEAKGDPETKLRARLLIREISTTHRVPPRLEFKLIVEKEWATPKPGENTAIDIRLQVTNSTDSVCRLYLDKAVKVILQDSTGKELRSTGGRQRKMAAAIISSPLSDCPI
jgi:hypothetical protein